MKKTWALIAGLFLLTSCGKEIPSDVIQPERMEKVLYDYHVALSMDVNTSSVDNYRREAYKEYIFDKHDITSAQFDSSMVWYTREAKELSAIYENLSKRFNREYKQIEMKMISRKDGDRLTASGDSVDIWNQSNIIWLTESILANQVLVDIDNDTTFYPKDAFHWSVDCHFLGGGTAIMGLNVIYANDSVIGETRFIPHSGRYTISLQPDSAYKMREINGFIAICKDSVQKPVNLLLHNISLMRYHAAGDSLKKVEPQTLILDGNGRKGRSELNKR